LQRNAIFVFLLPFKSLQQPFGPISAVFTAFFSVSYARMTFFRAADNQAQTKVLMHNKRPNA